MWECCTFTSTVLNIPLDIKHVVILCLCGNVALLPVQCLILHLILNTLLFSVCVGMLYFYQYSAQSCTFSAFVGLRVILTTVESPVTQMPCHQPVCFNLFVSTCLFQPVCFNLFVSTCLFQPVCFNLFVSTCLFQPVCFNLCVATCLFQPVCFNLFVSTYLFQPVCFNLFVSTCLFQPVCFNLFVSTCLFQPVCFNLFVTIFCKTSHHYRTPQYPTIYYPQRQGFYYCIL